MAFPVVTVRKPALLAGQTNGRLDPSILVTTPGMAGGPDVRLVAPASKAWQAMTAAAQRDGIVLKASGVHDSFRPYDVQERIFRARFTTSYLAGRPRRSWLGRWWYLRPGMALAAVPGTSNHGWGLAVDAGVELDGDAGTESIDARALAWLREHAAEFGWSWEVQSEPWHLRYWAGDNPPPAVAGYSEGDEDMPTTQEIVEALRPVVRAEANAAVVEVMRSPEFDVRDVDDITTGLVGQVAATRRLARAGATAALVALGMSADEAAAEVGRVEGTPNAVVDLGGIGDG